ncbi:MAG TPA: AI-2E family transporter, partial [Bordetella sp.]|nr:AI-2E family transporter [Bordetella sp.]
MLSAALIITGLYYGRDVLIPLAFAFLISFALSPLVAWMVRVHLPRSVSVVLVMAVLFIVLGCFALLLGTQLRALSLQLPAYQSTMLEKLANLRSELNAPGIFDPAI